MAEFHEEMVCFYWHVEKNECLRMINRNEGELAEGWYDPETKRKADMRARDEERAERRAQNNDDEDSDEIGPEIPDHDAGGGSSRAGPAMPKTHDLEYRRGTLFTAFFYKGETT
jgi:hypothetical protein